jgi:hypothetical protein
MPKPLKELLAQVFAEKNDAVSELVMRLFLTVGALDDMLRRLKAGQFSGTQAVVLYNLVLKGFGEEIDLCRKFMLQNTEKYMGGLDTSDPAYSRFQTMMEEWKKENPPVEGN